MSIVRKKILSSFIYLLSSTPFAFAGAFDGNWEETPDTSLSLSFGGTSSLVLCDSSEAPLQDLEPAISPLSPTLSGDDLDDENDQITAPSTSPLDAADSGDVSAPVLRALTPQEQVIQSYLELNYLPHVMKPEEAAERQEKENKIEVILIALHPSYLAQLEEAQSFIDKANQAEGDDKVQAVEEAKKSLADLQETRLRLIEDIIKENNPEILSLVNTFQAESLNYNTLAWKFDTVSVDALKEALDAPDTMAPQIRKSFRVLGISLAESPYIDQFPRAKKHIAELLDLLDKVVAPLIFSTLEKPGALTQNQQEYLTDIAKNLLDEENTKISKELLEQTENSYMKMINSEFSLKNIIEGFFRADPSGETDPTTGDATVPATDSTTGGATVPGTDPTTGDATVPATDPTTGDATTPTVQAPASL